MLECAIWLNAHKWYSHVQRSLSYTCADILSRLHGGHQGVTKCRERARQSVWWPGLSSEIVDMVKSCKACITFQDKQSKPLRPSMFPDRPWKRIASVIFHWQNKEYILVITYYSRYIELMKLDLCPSWRTPSLSYPIMAHNMSVNSLWTYPGTRRRMRRPKEPYVLSSAY